MQEKLVSRAKELLSDGTVVRVLGWRKGDTDFSAEPAFFETAESLSEFTYDGFCGANLSKYMIKASKEEGKTLVFLKPCDTYSFNQLIKEHRVDREKTYIVGIGCDGKLDIEKIREAGCKGITAVTEDGDTIKVATVYGDKELAREDVILERCKACKGGNTLPTTSWQRTATKRNRQKKAVLNWLRSSRQWLRKSVSHSGRTNCPAVSAVMHAVTYVRPAAVSNVSSIMTVTIPHRKQIRLHLKSRCSTLSVHSTLPDAAPTVASVPVYVRSTFRCTC